MSENEPKQNQDIENAYPKILIVDDTLDNLIALEHLLSDMPIELVRAQSGNEALQKLVENKFALILLDVQMPEMDGFETAELIRRYPQTKDTPIIFVTAINKDEKYVRKGHEIGAVDYLCKPVDPVVLRRKVSVFLEQYNHNQQLEEKVKGLHDAQAKLEQNNAQLNQLAHFDLLTGLPNRLHFEETVANVIENSNRYRKKFAILFLDLDNFKFINDHYGHAMGDKLLTKVSQRLTKCIRSADSAVYLSNERIVARLGGDEFAIVVTDLNSSLDAGSIANRLLMSIEKPFKIEGQDLSVGLSIGIACYPDAGMTLEVLCKNADMAMYRSKKMNKGRHQFFTEKNNQAFQRRYLIEQALPTLFESDQLHVVYQPVYQLTNKEIDSIEALLRWQHPELGEVETEELLAVIEKSDELFELGRWMIETVFSQIQQWKKQHCRVPTIALKLPLVQFRDESFYDFLTLQLINHDLSANEINIEVSETDVMRYVPAIENIYKKLSTLGFTFSIDDFGVGYSSLAQMQTIPAKIVKINKDLVDHLCDDELAAVIVSSILVLSTNSGIQVIAKGIESEEQHTRLIDQGCQYGQGMYLCTPKDPEFIQGLLKVKDDKGKAS